MKSFDTINVIPFIDILLVLLAMVLTTATFINTGQLDIALPAATAAHQSSTLEPIVIAIDESEQLYLDGKALSIEELDNQLTMSIRDTGGKMDENVFERAGVASSGPLTPVHLMVDEQVSFQRFVSVADLLKRLSMDDVSIVTKPNR